MTELRIDVLGDFAAYLGSEVVDLGGRRQRAVLAVLLLARGSVVAADHLIDCLWGEEASPTAGGALQSYISHLRRRLEPGRSARGRNDRIVRKGPGYALRLDDDAVDAWRFERLVRTAASASPAEAVSMLGSALELWRGPILAEYATDGWAQAESARLDELREVAKEQRAAARLELGETAVLVPELETLVNAEPLREERWRLLVLALYRCGRQGDALAALRRARQTLSDELGIDPGPALRSLEADVLAQAPSLEGPPIEVMAPPLPTLSATVPSGRSQHDLVDRAREVADLRELIASGLAGEGRVALVEGPAGIGKSRLLAEARNQLAGRDVTVLTARGSQLEREFAFGAVRQLFEPVLADPARRQRLLVGAASSAAFIFDVAATHAEGADRTFAALHGLYWLSVNLSRDRPLVLVVDDIQWCDTSSVRFVAYLARRLEDLPVLVLASLRTGEEHADAALISELQLDLSTALIRPGPLSTAGVGALVEERLGPADEAFVRACHRTTSGNPLLVRQLVRALEAEGVRPDVSHADTVTAIGSRAVSSMVLMRLSRLPAAASAAAAAIAVLGDGHALPAVAGLSGLGESEAATAIGALARAEIIRNEHPLGFVHPLVQDAVYRNIPTGERELQHERAAQVLRAASVAPEQIAAHLLKIPHRGDRAVVALLREAATMAGERGAAEGAVTYLTRALAEPPTPEVRAEVLVSLGRTQAALDGPMAARHLRDAYQLTTDPAQRGPLAVTLAWTLVFAGDRGEASAFAAEAGADLPADRVDDRQALLALERLSGYMQIVDPAAWRRGDVPPSVGDGQGARMLAVTRAWELLIDNRDREVCVELCRFALAGGPAIETDPGLFWAVAGVVLILADEDVGPLWTDAVVDAHAGGSLFAVMTSQLWHAFDLWRRGDLSEAYQLATRAAEQSEAWGANTFGVPYGHAFRICVLVDQGDLAAAREVLEGTQDLPRMGDGDCLYQLSHARLLIAEGRYDDALRRLDSADRVRPLMSNPVWQSSNLLRGQALIGLGRTDDAIALIEGELAGLRRWGAAGPIGNALRLLGEARGPAGLEHLREAVDVLAESPARLEYARALHRHSRERGGDPAATTDLSRALDIARRCGAHALVAEIADVLRRAGATVSAEAPAAGLSTSERRIATMVLDGADELEIAQQLYVTPRSVRATITAIKDRLGVATLADARPLLLAP